MSEVNTLVQQAISAYKANDKAKAKDLLLKAVDLDEQNEQAWMWMSAVVDSLEDQQICLENVIQINPNNERARKGLAAINEKLGKSAAPPSAPKEDDNPWAGTGFDSSPFNAPGQPAAAVPPVYGSDPAGDPTSGEQYDNWIDSLGINSESSSSTPEPADDDPWANLNTDSGQANPFVADSSASSDSDAWGQSTSDTAQQTDPWGNPTDSNPFSSDASTNDPWGSVTGVDPWATNSGQNAPANDPFGTSAGTSFTSQDAPPDEAEEERATTGFQFAEDSEPTYSSFDFDAVDEVEDDTVVDDFSFGEDDFQDDPFGDEDDDLNGFDPFAVDEDNIDTVIAAKQSNYLQQIPEELRGKGGGSSPVMLLLVVILLVANLAAAAGLVMG